MEYTDWLWIKFVLVVGGAFVWGVYRGLTGQPLWLESSEEGTVEQQDRPAGR